MSRRRDAGAVGAPPDGRSPAGLFTAVLFAAEASAAAGFLWLAADPRRSPLRLALLAVSVAAVLAGLTAAGARILGRRTGRPPAELARALVARLSPLLLLALVFVQFFVFLRDLRPVLPWISLLGAGYLVSMYVAGLSPKAGPAIAGPEKARSWPLGVAAFVLYAFLASGLVVPAQPFSGDEPHYLLVTRSLVSDGDINVADDYLDQDYRAFYPGPLENHAFLGRKGPGHEYSRHLPGVSVLVAPFYMAGERVAKALSPGPGEAERRARTVICASRLAMCLLAALLGAAFHVLALRVTGRRRPALLAWAVFSLTSPLLYYSQLLYPEVPVALVSLLVFLGVTTRGVPRNRTLWLAGAGIAALPWFGIKYVSISILLFLVCFLALPRTGGRRGEGLIRLAAAPAVSAALYLAFFWALYGSLSPTAAYGNAIPTDHIAFSSKGAPGITEVLRFFFGYLFDQRFGIIPHSAAYLALFGGGILLWRRDRRLGLPVLSLFVVYGLQGAFVRIWGGYCPPGRLVLAVLWIPALLLAEAFAADGTRLRKALVAGTVALSFAAAYAGVRDARLLYNENVYTVFSGPGTFSRLLASLSNDFVDPRMWVPSFANWDAARTPATFGWLLAAAAAAWAFAGGRRTGGRPAGAFGWGVHAAVVAALSAAILGYAFFNVRSDVRTAADPDGLEVLFQDGNAHGPEPDGFWTRGGREATVLVRSTGPLASLSVSLSSPVPGRTLVRAGMTDRLVLRKERNTPPATVVIEAPIGARLGGRYLYSLRIGDSAAFVPYKLDRRVGDDRNLGVRVSISGRPAGPLLP